LTITNTNDDRSIFPMNPFSTHPVFSRRRVNPRDPKPAVLSLLRSTIPVLVLPRLVHAVPRGFYAILRPSAETLGRGEDLIPHRHRPFVPRRPFPRRSFRSSPSTGVGALNQSFGSESDHIKPFQTVSIVQTEIQKNEKIVECDPEYTFLGHSDTNASLPGSLSLLLSLRRTIRL